MAGLRPRKKNTKVVIVGMLKRIFENKEPSVIRELQLDDLSLEQLYLAKIHLSRLNWLVERAMRGSKKVIREGVPDA